MCHKYGDMLPQSTRSAQRSFWKLIDEAPETRLEPPASSPQSYSWSAVYWLPRQRRRERPGEKLVYDSTEVLLLGTLDNRLHFLYIC